MRSEPSNGRRWRHRELQPRVGPPSFIHEREPHDPPRAVPDEERGPRRSGTLPKRRRWFGGAVVQSSRVGTPVKDARQLQRSDEIFKLTERTLLEVSKGGHAREAGTMGTWRTSDVALRRENRSKHRRLNTPLPTVAMEFASLPSTQHCVADAANGQSSGAPVNSKSSTGSDKSTCIAAPEQQ
ncbi:hypothetical protein BD311DRAFT_753382 [Dichomitus squalens]|uniref:Uncharacterized protein n=1 Tax=Dichomitus squalens TaxID=114155 RepID=A0A4Q9MX78_9APHY|nr:hypothetical protein BD311DRAFT_753382 [Dichomitus squalens]